MGRPRALKDPALSAIRVNSEFKSILDRYKRERENYGMTALRLIKEATENKKKLNQLDEKVYLLAQEIEKMQWEISYLDQGNQGHYRIQRELKLQIFNLQVKLAEQEKQNCLIMI